MKLNKVQLKALENPGYSAKVLADSTAQGHRLTTIEYRAPRCIVAELNTHRTFSRNSRSSRAVPSRVLVGEVTDQPYIPVWTKNLPGMKGVELYTAEEEAFLTGRWLRARDEILYTIEDLAHLAPHKQSVNRLLEPWMWTYGVISATEWENFFRLRLHTDADPAIFALAYHIDVAIKTSTPVQKEAESSPSAEDNCWHLPYVSEEDFRAARDPVDFRLVSAARCARVSYTPFGGGKLPASEQLVSDAQKGVELFSHNPPHSSPFEHIATPQSGTEGKTGNFRGWNQFRKILER